MENETVKSGGAINNMTPPQNFRSPWASVFGIGRHLFGKRAFNLKVFTFIPFENLYTHGPVPWKFYQSQWMGSFTISSHPSIHYLSCYDKLNIV